MKLDVAFTTESIDLKQVGGKRAVLIDVIRASTTIVTAFQNGCLSVTPVLTLEEAFEKAKAFHEGECLIGGEREGMRLEGFDLGNSPREYTRERVQGRHLVLSTTNGTKALRAVAQAKEVAIGCFLNASAVCRWAEGEGSDLLIACAGLRGGFSLEDAVCAGRFVEQLLQAVNEKLEKSDAAEACRILYHHFKDDLLGMLRKTEWGSEIERRGLLEYLKVCAQIDITDVVPRMHQGRITL